eukprot:NODE_25497_length_585_cov_2.353712.p2 GENE.NODE_25497_length_585_cov_2.353712~~NODE_25497_length_585_cov_2.353712.p2  ORF type:complete len:94 (+),score=22.21 NODE_25497_length_585_cov_2.353712:173-454(+)
MQFCVAPLAVEPRLPRPPHRSPERTPTVERRARRPDRRQRCTGSTLRDEPAPSKAVHQSQAALNSVRCYPRVVSANPKKKKKKKKKLGVKKDS